MKTERRLEMARKKSWSQIQEEITSYIDERARYIDGYQSNNGFAFGDSAHTSFSIAWAVECDLRVNGVPELVTHDGSDYMLMTVSCSVSWSSTGRSLPCALAAVNLYSDVINLGAKIESHFNKEYIVEVECS